jgi:hypothetical protein
MSDPAKCSVMASNGRGRILNLSKFIPTRRSQGRAISRIWWPSPIYSTDSKTIPRCGENRSPVSLMINKARVSQVTRNLASNAFNRIPGRNSLGRGNPHIPKGRRQPIRGEGGLNQSRHSGHGRNTLVIQSVQKEEGAPSRLPCNFELRLCPLLGTRFFLRWCWAIYQGKVRFRDVHAAFDGTGKCGTNPNGENGKGAFRIHGSI